MQRRLGLLGLFVLVGVLIWAGTPEGSVLKLFALVILGGGLVGLAAVLVQRPSED